jgi:hypothetical protein
MQLKQTKALLLSMSEDGVVIIAEVNRKAEEQKKKNHTWRREYYVSESCLKANIASGRFKDITEKVDYDGRIYALADDLA